MIKKLLVSIMAISLLSLTAFAATGLFTDQEDFSDWYASSAEKMFMHGIMSGIDGAFEPGIPVNRAQLAVILDRYTKKIVEKELYTFDNIPICTEDVKVGLTIHLRDLNGTPLDGASIIVKNNDTVAPFRQYIETSDNFLGEYYGLDEQEGYFNILIEKEGYADYLETIKLEKDICHVIPQVRTVTMIPAP